MVRMKPCRGSRAFRSRGECSRTAVRIDLCRGTGAFLSKEECDCTAVWIDVYRGTRAFLSWGERDRTTLWIDSCRGTSAIPPRDSCVRIVGGVIGPPGGISSCRGEAAVAPRMELVRSRGLSHWDQGAPALGPWCSFAPTSVVLGYAQGGIAVAPRTKRDCTAVLSESSSNRATRCGGGPGGAVAQDRWPGLDAGGRRGLHGPAAVHGFLEVWVP